MKKFFVMMCAAAMAWSTAGAQLTLTLDEALEMALSENPTMKVADLEIERYDYVRKQTLANLYPQIDASGQYTRSIVKQEMAKGLSFGADNTLTATGNISLALFVPSVYRQLKMNKTEMASAVESARNSRIELVADVRTAFYNILLAEQSLSVLQESVITTQRVVDNTEVQFRNGVASEYDYITAKVQLSNLKPSVMQAENAVELSKLQLKMYLSIPEDIEIEVKGSLDDMRTEVLLGSDNLSTDISHNSSLRTLDLQRELLEHQVKLIQTQRMPTVAAFGSAVYTGNDMERLNFGGMMGGGADTPEGGTAEAVAQASSNSFWWQHPINVGLQISIPIFSGFAKTNQVRSVRNQIRQIDLQRSYAEEGVSLQIRQSINNLLTARETMLANEQTVEQAQKAYDISYTRYGAGAGTILELNSAQLQLTQAQLNYSQSIYDYLSSKAEYDKVAGTDEYANRE
ncbi:MAG: TolC family protein [Alistipes sp.]|nr:TolC family protein [Alistipes sp.]